MTTARRCATTTAEPEIDPARGAAWAVAIWMWTIAPPAGAQDTVPLLLDPSITVGAGATIPVAIGDVVARAEDALIPVRLFEERGVTRRTVNITYRLLKLALFDAPQEQVLVVVNHEVFGHGARLRERFDGPIGYRIEAPAPYGSGGGATSFDFDREPTVHEMLAVSTGGMEADGVAAQLMAHRSFLDGKMRLRDAIRYLGFELDTFTYVLSTGDGAEEPGHDVADFLERYNQLARAEGASGVPARRLRREVLLALANPMLAYAAMGIGRYIWSGAPESGVLAVSIAGVRYLPLLRYRLTPYGTEWSLMNHLAGRIPPVQIELRVGRSPGATPWGVAVRDRPLRTLGQWHLAVSVDVWRQPPLVESGAESAPRRMRLGAETRARLERAIIPVWFSARRASFIVELGVKTAGYVPGEPLRGGFVARAGVGIPTR